MLRVGLTGGIGAGKSTIARRLAEHGAVLVDADLLARAVVGPGTPGLAEVINFFGPDVLAPDGTLDRSALGRRVFAEPDARRALEAITHPRIADLTRTAVASAPPDAVLVHDVPLLVENAMAARYHLVLVVHAPQGERVARLVRDRGMTIDDAWVRVRAQASDDERRAAADVWLDNSGQPGEVLAEVDRLWDERLIPFERNVRQRLCGRAGSDDVDRDRRGSADAAAISRVVARLTMAAGRPASVAEDGSVVIAIGDDEAEVAGVGAALEEAGFPHFPAQDGTGVHCSADPSSSVLVRLTHGSI